MSAPTITPIWTPADARAAAEDAAKHLGIVGDEITE